MIYKIAFIKGIFCPRTGGWDKDTCLKAKNKAIAEQSQNRARKK